MSKYHIYLGKTCLKALHFICFSMATFVCFPVLADQCSAIFPGAAQNHDVNGEIIFDFNGQILNNPTNSLYTNNLTVDNSSSLLSCDTMQCVAGNEIVPTIADVDYGNSNNNINVPQDRTRTRNPGNYNNITMEFRSTLRLNSGDYYLRGNISLDNESQIIIVGSGPVRIFVGGTVELEFKSTINASGSSEALLLYVRNNITLDNETEISGFIYSQADVSLDFLSRVDGAVTARNINIENSAIINFDSDIPDFGDSCSARPVIPISCAANDVPNIAFSDDFSTVNAGWSAVDFDRSVSNWPGDVISQFNNENQFVVFDINSGSLKINGPLTNIGDNEYGMVKYELDNEGITKSLTDNYAFSADIIAIKQGTNNDVALTFGYIDDRNYYLARWTKYGTTYQSSTFPGVYRRFELVQVSNGVASTLDYIDDVDLDDPFNLEVVVNDLGTAVCVNDEALLYSDSTQPILHDIGIETYDNDRGLTIDNVELRCENCQDLTPIADYHFDSCEYTGLAGDIFDETGNYSGQSFGSLEVLDEGQVQFAANLVDERVRIETSIPVPDNFTVTTWFKKPETNSGGRYFVLGAMDGGGDLLYLDRDASYRWGVYNVNTGAANGTFNFSSLDENWHHLALVYSNGQTSLYIDGAFIETLAIAPTGTLKYMGTSFDGLDNGSPQGFRAPLDEFMVFDRRLSVTEINQIYDNQKLNNNYDGSPRANVVCEALLAEFRFEELTWNGNLGEVEDQTGNFDSVARNGAFTANIDSAIVGNPGTCRYGSFDDDYIELPGTFDNLTDSFTITAWIKPSNTQAGSRIFIDDKFNTGGYGFSLGDPGSGQLRFYSRGVSPISVDTASVINTNVWTFVTAVHDAENNTRQIYVNGVAQILTGGVTNPIYGGTWGEDDGPATIGGEPENGEENNRFTGDMDEVRVYTGALTAAKINDIYQETHPCDNFIDHFEIVHDGNGITCDAEDITIKACANSNCSIIDSTATDVTLSVNGTVNRTVTVIGETNTDFSFTTPGIATLSLDYAYECKNGASSSCDVEFSETGFIITDIPTQLSGKPSNTGYGAKNLFLRAVKTDDESGTCIGVFPDGGDVPVNLSYTCESGTCSNNLALTNNGSVKSLTQTSSSYDLRFDSQSRAQFSLQYPDAGELRLNAQKTIEVENDEGDTEILIFNSSSNAFVERPFAFAINLANGNALSEIAGVANASGSVFTIAGEEFPLTLTAVQWQTGQDGDADGIPSKADFITINSGSNATAQHFNNQTITLDDTLVLPDPSLDGTEGVFMPTTLSFGTNNNSEINDNFTYSEVGIINLSAQLSSTDYLGAGNIYGEIYNIGRFTPAYFKQSIEVGNEGSLTVNHNDSSVSCEMLDWAYSGQQTDNKGSIIYGVQPILTITAYNSDDVPVKNYIGDFAKLVTNFSSTSIQLDAAATTHTNLLPLASDVSTSGEVPILNGDNIIEYTLSTEHHFTYVRDNLSKIAPFDGSFEIPINTIIDSDLVELKPTDINGSYFENPTFSETKVNTVNIRFGRWVMQNSFGPETENLPMKHLIEQYNGSAFVVNEDEVCLIPSITTKKTGALGETGLNLYDYRLIEIDAAYPIKKEDTDVSVMGSFDEGVFEEFVFSAPNERGPLQIEYKVPDWLLYGWSDENGPHTENPRAIATFGLFRGNDRIIYWSEK